MRLRIVAGAYIILIAPIILPTSARADLFSTATYSTTGIFTCVGCLGSGTNSVTFSGAGADSVTLTYSPVTNNTVTLIPGDLDACGGGCWESILASGGTLTVSDSAAEQHDNATIPISARFDLTLTQSLPVLAGPQTLTAQFSGNIADSGTVQNPWADYSFSASAEHTGFADFFFPGQDIYRIWDAGDFFPTVTGGFVGGFVPPDAFTFQIFEPTPEPGSISLLLTVLAGAGMLVRKKRQRRFDSAQGCGRFDGGRSRATR